MKLNYFFMYILLFGFFNFAGCTQDEPETPKENETPVVVPKVSLLNVHPGKNRVKVTWTISENAGIRNIRVYWNGEQDWVDVPVKEVIVNMETIIDDLAEGHYLFSVCAFDKDDNASAKVSTNGRAYGSEYESYLVNRPIQNAIFKEETSTAVIVWSNAETGSMGLEIKYTDADEVAHRVEVEPSATITTLNNFVSGEEFAYRTLYKPTTTAIDTFYTDYENIEVVPAFFEDPTTHGYSLQSSMQGVSSLTNKDYTQIHSYMRQFGWDYSEHPNSSDNDHKDGIHCQNIYDETLKQHVFKFMIHVNPFLDGDRGKMEDRQRNEMKSQTSSSWYKMNGNWDEWQWLEWKFKIPKGFRPSTSFCHIHQLKAQEGNNGSPLITITLRGNNDGTNKKVQVIHTGDVSSTNKGRIVDNIPIEEFEDEWVQVQEEVHYTHNGFFRIKIIRISDHKVLMDYSIQNIDLWRKGATNIRNKFGIYRSYGKTLSDPNDRPSNGIKDESLLLGDFYIYEKNSNPYPQAHD